MSLEKVVANLAQQIERRFYGKYRGIVVDNADPEHLGRLKVKVPSILGSDVVTGWAMPCVPYGGEANQGFLFIPETEAGVWVEFEGGDLEFPIWTGTFWSKPGDESELPLCNGEDGKEEDTIQDPPTRKIIKTRKGHTIQMEDADEEEMLTIIEATHGHVITMDASGITIADGTNSDNKIIMEESGLTIHDTNGHKIVFDSDGITLQSKANVSIKSEADVTIEGKEITIEATGQLTAKGNPVHLNP